MLFIVRSVKKCEKNVSDYISLINRYLWIQTGGYFYSVVYDISLWDRHGEGIPFYKRKTVQQSMSIYQTCPSPPQDQTPPFSKSIQCGVYVNLRRKNTECVAVTQPLWMGVVGCGEGVVFITSSGRPTDTDLQLGKACYPCSR